MVDQPVERIPCLPHETGKCELAARMVLADHDVSAALNRLVYGSVLLRRAGQVDALAVAPWKRGVIVEKLSQPALRALGRGHERLAEQAKGFDAGQASWMGTPQPGHILEQAPR